MSNPIPVTYTNITSENLSIQTHIHQLKKIIQNSKTTTLFDYHIQVIYMMNSPTLSRTNVWIKVKINKPDEPEVTYNVLTLYHNIYKAFPILIEDADDNDYTAITKEHMIHTVASIIKTQTKKLL